MNRDGWLKHYWLDKDNRVVHTTMTTPEQGTIMARVDLQNGSVEVIEAKFLDPSAAVTPSDEAHILYGAQAFERGQRLPYPDNLRWCEEDTVFDTMRESREWVSSGIYNEIGNLYDGYRTADEKMAYALVYELTRLNTSQGSAFLIFADNEFGGDRPHFRVWVQLIQDPLKEL